MEGVAAVSLNPKGNSVLESSTEPLWIKLVEWREKEGTERDS